MSLCLGTWGQGFGGCFLQLPVRCPVCTPASEKDGVQLHKWSPLLANCHPPLPRAPCPGTICEVTCPCYPSSWEAETEELLWIWSYLGLHMSSRSTWAKVWDPSSERSLWGADLEALGEERGWVWKNTLGEILKETIKVFLKTQKKKKARLKNVEIYHLTLNVNSVF